jgi:glycosyltransferase involved in cell wall biosynthesis
MLVDLAKRFGGADVRVLRLAAEMSAYRPCVVATIAGSALQARLESTGQPHLVVRRRRGDPRVALDLARALRAGRYEVVDAQNPQSQLWALGAGLLARVPVRVTTVHSQYLAEHGGSRRGRAYEAVLRLNRLAGSRFIAVSDATLEYVRSLGVPPARVALIANAVPPATPDPAGRGAVLGPWPADAYVVGVVARLEPIKGVADLIDAAALARRHEPRLRLLVVGDGRAREELEARAAGAGLGDAVRFLGFRDDVATLMSGLDALCLPSHSEGLPFALLEAAAHGLPLVVTRVGGMALLLDDGLPALGVPPKDPPALAAALRALAEDPASAAEMGARARAVVGERFSVDRMVEATLRAYGERVTPATAGASPS